MKLLRNLQFFYSLYLSEGIDAVTGPDGDVYSIFDIIGIFEKRDALLSPQRAKAVELILYQDMAEKEAALAMGLHPTAPVSAYASAGAKVLAAAWPGEPWLGEEAALCPTSAATCGCATAPAASWRTRPTSCCGTPLKE
jgi:hypothetical protein